MNRRLHLLLPTMVCMLALPLCALGVNPRVELGIVDDWSYIRTAQVLADTGHVAYNGWATATLGWQLYVGALFLKLFGFSFTAPRVGTLLIAILTAALMQRVLVRMGLTPWNSAAATLVLVLSPVFMAVTFSFMSDVYGMLALVGCCYGCVRALQAATEAKAVAWITAAALGNAVAGTARQIAWMGLLVMVPCTLWLLRSRRRVVWQGMLSVLAGALLILAALAWYRRQPFIIPEHLLPESWPGSRVLVLHILPDFVRLCVGELLLLAAPLLVVFTPAILRSRLARIAAGPMALLGLVALLALAKMHRLDFLRRFLVPYVFNNVWFYGLEYFHAYVGFPPLLLTERVQVAVTAVALLGGLGLLATLLFFVEKKRVPVTAVVESQRPLDLRTVCWLLLPCAAASLLILLPRLVTFGGLVDRYFLFPEFVLLAIASRVYQRVLQPRFSRLVWVTIAIFAFLDTAGLHDTFALDRAQAALLKELTSHGVPREAIDGGAQYNGWTEVVLHGHLSDPRMINPPSATRTLVAISPFDPCHTEYLGVTPSIRAAYVVSLDPKACGGQSEFAPVRYWTYFGPHERSIYAVRGPYAGAGAAQP